MRVPSYLVMLWALLFVTCRPTDAQTVAVFDFELIDTSLQGEISGTRADEQARLTRLGDQLRQRLRESGRFSVIDITPIARGNTDETWSRTLDWLVRNRLLAPGYGVRQ